MISILSKHREQIGIDDIHELIRSGIPESEQIEYKKELSNKGNGQPDDWMTGKKKVGDMAKDKLVREVIAMTNSQGGAIILGIDESQEMPPVASNINLIPQCANLSDILFSTFLSRIEPSLALLEVIPIKTREDSGLVVIRVGKSRQAPHRDTKSRKCFVRRHDQSREMTMREIQDMTLNLSRGLEQVERKFSNRSERFKMEVGTVFNPVKALGVRVTAVPIDDNIRMGRVCKLDKVIDPLLAEWQKVFLVHANGKRIELETHTDFDMIYWRPILRGVRADSDSFQKNYGQVSDAPRDQKPDQNSYREIHSDGLIELGFVSRVIDSIEYGNYLSPNDPLALLANLIFQIDLVRSYAATPLTEFAIEVELYAFGTSITIGRPSPEARHPIGTIEARNTLLPRYPLGDIAETPDLLKLLFQDLHDLLGKDARLENYKMSVNEWSQ